MYICIFAKLQGELAPATIVQQERLDIGQLGAMLAQLGFNPNLTIPEGGKSVYYKLKFESGDWTINHWVSLSRDQSMIWFYSNLVEVKGSSAVVPEALLGLLEEDVWPAYVFYSKKAQWVRLAMPVKNKDVTPAELRKKIDTFTDHVKATIQRYQKESKLVKGE